MKINKMTASFGKLQKDTLTLHDGLNVICAPNESGKSTWCAFIRAMLYGVDSSQRSKAGMLADKQRYAPWSGAPMEGSMELTSHGRELTLTRSTRLKSAPMREFSAYYTGTSLPVEGMDGENAGELLTGVTREVFRRSAFMGQGDMAVSASPDLEKRILSLVSAGEEECSFTEADSRLRAWHRKRRYNQRGLLPELEREMGETEKLLSELDSSAQQMTAMEERLDTLRVDCARLEGEVAEARREQRREAMAHYTQARSRAKETEEAREAALDRYEEKCSLLRAHPLAGAGGEEEAHTALTRLGELDKTAEVAPSPLLWIVLLVLTGVLAGLATVGKLLWAALPAAAALAAAVVVFLRYRGKKAVIASALAEKEEIFARYAIEDQAGLSRLLAEYRTLRREEREAEDLAHRACQRQEAVQRELKTAEEAALSDLDFAAGSSPAARLGRELAEKRREAEQLSARLSALQGRLSVMGDSMVLRSELGCLAQRHGEISEELAAIELAEEALRAADGEMQRRFSPALGRTAAGYMNRLTGGRYDTLLLNRDFSALAHAEADTVAHESGYLSTGTLDLLYLSLRLAVCELALPQGEGCPLILDDALVNLDEVRFERAMALLEEIAKTRQVILFTCRRD